MLHARNRADLRVLDEILWDGKPVQPHRTQLERDLCDEIVSHDTTAGDQPELARCRIFSARRQVTLRVKSHVKNNLRPLPRPGVRECNRSCTLSRISFDYAWSYAAYDLRTSGGANA